MITPLGVTYSLRSENLVIMTTDFLEVCSFYRYKIITH